MMSEPINQYSESCAALISNFKELWFQNKAKLRLFSLNEDKCPKYFWRLYTALSKKNDIFTTKKRYQNSFCKMGDTLCGLKINAEFSFCVLVTIQQYCS